MPQLVRNPPFYFHSARYHNSRLRLLPCCNMINETQGISCNNWIQQSSLARMVLSVWCNCLFGNAQIEHECWYRNCIFSYECVFWVKGQAEARAGACKEPSWLMKLMLLCFAPHLHQNPVSRRGMLLSLYVSQYVRPVQFKKFYYLAENRSLQQAQLFRGWRLGAAQKAKAVFLHS